jgi:hypothetical protein
MEGPGLTSGLRAVPLSAGEHLAHEIVLRKDFNVVFERFVRLCILL